MSLARRRNSSWQAPEAKPQSGNRNAATAGSAGDNQGLTATGNANKRRRATATGTKNRPQSARSIGASLRQSRVASSSNSPVLRGRMSKLGSLVMGDAVYPAAR